MINNQAMIAFLPIDGSWCKQPLPHMTLAYAGTIDDRSDTDFNGMAKDAITVARMTGSFSLPVIGIEEFGDEDDRVDVLVFYPSPQLLIARKTVEHWDTGKYKNYKPHATIGSAGSASETFRTTDDIYSEKHRYSLPLNLHFNRIGAFWGDRNLIFNLSEF